IVREMRWRVVIWLGLAALIAFAGMVWLALAQLRPEPLRTRVTNALATRLNADVAIESLEVTLLPRLRLTGGGVTLRVRNHTELPPFVAIDRFSMDLGLFSMFRRHVDTLHVDGLKIQVPPGDARKGFGGSTTAADESLLNPSKVIIEHLVTHNAELAFVSSNPAHRPIVFVIESLELDQLGF